MKKIILLVLIAVAFNIANAQDAKPTKEETQKFITNMISQVIGAEPTEYTRVQINDQLFSDGFTAFKKSMIKINDSELSFSETSLIGWCPHQPKYF